MCLSCGCGLPNEDHGDDRHLTHGDLVRAAQAAGVTPKQALKNMRKTLKASKDHLATARHEHADGPGSAPKIAQVQRQHTGTSGALRGQTLTQTDVDRALGRSTEP